MNHPDLRQHRTEAKAYLINDPIFCQSAPSTLALPSMSYDGGQRRSSIKRETRFGSMVGMDADPTDEEVKEQMDHRPSMVEVKELSKERKGVSNKKVTGASQITLKQSIFPICLVTILFFLWGFAYGLLDVLYAFPSPVTFRLASVS